MLNKTEGKESWKKKKRNLSRESKFFQRSRSHKTTKQSSRVVVRINSEQCHLANIDPAMEQSDWLNLFIGLLK